MLADSPGELVRLSVKLRPSGDGRTKDISVHITAHSEGVEKSLGNILNSGPHGTMMLERLPGGDLKGPISMFIRGLIHKKPLLGTANTSGHLNTNRESVGQPDGRGFALASNVPVVLFVDPMELCELSVGQGKCPVVLSKRRWA